MDKCTKITMEFSDDVLGPYSWTWEGEKAEKVFSALRDKFRVMILSGDTQPNITDLRAKGELKVVEEKAS